MNAHSNAADEVAASDSPASEAANFSDLRRCLWTLCRLGIFCAAGWMTAFGLGRLYRPTPRVATIAISSTQAQHGLSQSSVASVPNVSLAVENNLPLQDQPATVLTQAPRSTIPAGDDPRFPLKASVRVSAIDELHP